MKKLYMFIHINYKVLIGLIIGLILGYVHWFYFGCYWGTYPMASECWVNCTMGAIFGGFLASLTDSRNYE